MQKIILLVGIPLLAVAGIVAYETGNILWFGLGLPMMALRYYQRRIMRPDSEFTFRTDERPSYTEDRHTAMHDKE